MKNPAKFVKNIRRVLDLSQDDLAQVLRKRDSRAIRKWEQGDCDPPFTDLAVMALLMHCVVRVPRSLITADFLANYIDEIIEWCEHTNQQEIMRQKAQIS